MLKKGLMINDKSTMFEKQKINPLIREPLMTEDVSTLKRLVKVNKLRMEYSAVLNKGRDSVKNSI